jgi:hypothetical protein
MKWPEWANKLGLEVTKLAPFINNFKCVLTFSPLLGNRKHFALLKLSHLL